MLEKLRAQAARHPQWILALITVLALAPFLAKPANIDDPLFIWVARQIHAHPGNPYGFNVNWEFQELPMSQATENPPLACYYLALAAGIFGWSEVGLHFAFLLPAVLVILGTQRLARRLCQSPGLAALMTLLTPVFLISANTLMCDVLMLAFWIWAVAFWVEGMEQENWRSLAAAGVLVSLAEVTKYYGVCLIPLLAAHGLILTRRPGRWACFLLIPLATIPVYQLATASLYGRGLLGAAAQYATAAKGLYGFSKVSACLVGLAFTGGCAAVAVFFAPLLWRKKAVFAGVAVTSAVVLGLLAPTVLQKYPSVGSRTLVEFQFIFWALGGLSILALAISEVWRKRDAASWLLALWVWGTFVFAALVNWTANGRSLLPLAPAVAILVVRRLEERKLVRPKLIAGCLAASGAIALLAAYGDYSLACAVRNVAQAVGAKYGHGPGALWFEGHWGFHYYMEQAGGAPVDFKRSPLKFGDIVAVPSNNTNLRELDPKTSALQEALAAPVFSAPAIMDQTAGAGFYSSAWGPLPFAFGRVPPEYARVYELKQPSVARPPDSK
jgi:4-amino-4-deoxy-L-arabinose transferase-like glycosyltransferase